MAIAYVNSASGGSRLSLTSISTNAFSVTTGNLIVVGVRNDGGGAVTGVSDTAGNTYTQISAIVPYSLFYAKNITGNASNVITASFGASIFNAIDAVQYSGLDKTSPLDATATGTGSGSTTITSGTFSTSSADQIIVAGCQQSFVGASWTAESNYTKRVESYENITMIEDKIVSTTQSSITSSASSSSTVDKVILVATFKQIELGPANLKSFNGLAKASIKSINGLAIASIKSVNGLA